MLFREKAKKKGEKVIQLEIIKTQLEIIKTTSDKNEIIYI